MGFKMIWFSVKLSDCVRTH